MARAVRAAAPRPASRVRKAFVLLSVVFLVFALATGSAPADQGDTKDSFKKLGNKMKKFGKKVGAAGKEAGEEIAEVAKKVFYKGKKVSAPLLKKTQKATRDFWNDMIRQRKKTAKDLKEENASLRRQLEEDR